MRLVSSADCLMMRDGPHRIDQTVAIPTQILASKNGATIGNCIEIHSATLVEGQKADQQSDDEIQLIVSPLLSPPES
jgi:hypothetical protein